MKFEINDLAHISHAKFNDDKEITVIIGDNGSGKTLLLETVLLVKKKKKDLITSLLSILKNDQKSIKILFNQEKDKRDISEELANFFIEEELKRNKKSSSDLTSLADLNSLEEELQYIKSESTNFHWEGHITFSFTNTQEIEKIINGKLRELQQKLPSLISKEILFSTEDDAKVRLTDDRISIKKEYTILVEFEATNPLWIMRWKDHTNEIREEYDFIRLKNTPISMFRTMLTKIVYEYIFQETLGFSTSSQILMVPTERSQLMLSTNEDYTNLMKSQGSMMRYSESTFLKDYFLQKDYIFRQSLYPENPKLISMLGGRIQYDDDDNIIGILMDNGEIIDSRLFSTKQNRLMPYLFVQHLAWSNELQLIIEEPEANLSLKAIKELIDYLFSLIDNRINPIKIILTTHSDVFFQHLNLKLLQRDNISSRVYEFQNKKNKNVLIEHEKDEYGYSPQIFIDSLEELNIENEKYISYIEDESENEITIKSDLNPDKGNG